MASLFLLLLALPKKRDAVPSTCPFCHHAAIRCEGNEEEAKKNKTSPRTRRGTERKGKSADNIRVLPSPHPIDLTSFINDAHLRWCATLISTSARDSAHKKASGRDHMTKQTRARRHTYSPRHSIRQRVGKNRRVIHPHTYTHRKTDKEQRQKRRPVTAHITKGTGSRGERRERDRARDQGSVVAAPAAHPLVRYRYPIYCDTCLYDSFP